MIYIEVEADNNYDAGYLIGKQLKDRDPKALELALPDKTTWEELIEMSKPYLEATKKYLPQFVEELHGVADGAGMPFDKVFASNNEEEVLRQLEKYYCSSLLSKTQIGFISGHNEDNWGYEATDHLFVLKRTVRDVTVLELCYPLSLGGLSASVNSFGLVQSINSLMHKDYQVGVSCNFIGRLLSEARDFNQIKNEIKTITRSSGYNHNFLQNNKVMNIEMSAKNYDIFETEDNFVHSNHYTRKLKSDEIENVLKEDNTTYKRYKAAQNLVGNIENVDDMKKALSYASDIDPDASICNQYTLGSVIFDIKNKKAYFATNRPNPITEWMEISLDFLK